MCVYCQLSVGGPDAVRVPFTLPANTQNETQFQFYVNSISMPQRLKGTLTYVAKVDNDALLYTSHQVTHVVLRVLPCLSDKQ